MDEGLTSRGTSRQAALVAESFVSLADTLVDDFDVVEVLDRLARNCVRLLDVRAAAILISNHDRALEVVASSDEASRLMEVFQLESHAGPCIDAIETRQAVAVTDPVQLRRQWPAFARAVDGAGFTSVYAYPMRLREETFGALNLFDVGGRTLTEFDQRLAQSMADIATIGILQHRNLFHASELARQLQLALDTRIYVEQAKGVLAEHAGVGMEAAFAALRSYSRSQRLKLSDVARALVRRELDPSVLVDPRSRP